MLGSSGPSYMSESISLSSVARFFAGMMLTPRSAASLPAPLPELLDPPGGYGATAPTADLCSSGHCQMETGATAARALACHSSKAIRVFSGAQLDMIRTNEKLMLAAIVIGGLLLGAGIGAARWSGSTAAPAVARQQVEVGDGVAAPFDMVWVPGGEFMMGSDSRLARANERPAHRVHVDGVWMDRTHVTNAQFREFVAATHYVTTAERMPDWETMRVQLPAGTARPADDQLVPGALVFVGSERPVSLDDYSQWWSYVPGADWRHPGGPATSIEGKDDHPVVQVTYEDALAYAQWVGKRLPTEAEWEFAARGGLEQATYAWGEELTPNGQTMANIWQGRNEPFPVVSPKAGGAVGTMRAGTFPANGYGLVDMTGNAWHWVADWYRSDAFSAAESSAMPNNPLGPSASYDLDEPGVPVDAPKRVIRGGSFLCNESYCLSYRPSARRGNDPYNAMSHIGFRLVMTQEQWTDRKRTAKEAAPAT